MEIPATSVSLLKDLASGTAAVRWTEFCRRYEPVMRAFLDTRFPSVDADDTIQESLVALMKALPEYRYTPDQNGHFRNYLVGIVRHKALDALRREAARNALKTELATQERDRLLAPPAADPSKRTAFRCFTMRAKSSGTGTARTRRTQRKAAPSGQRASAGIPPVISITGRIAAC